MSGGAAFSGLGWYSRGYLPHFDSTGVVQAVTFRLADSLPQEKLAALEGELSRLVLMKSEADVQRRIRIEKWLDAGMGCCALRNPAMAATMEETLLKFDGERYRLLAWCIMPNHVHVLVEPRAALGKIVQSWKSYTGRWALERGAELGLGEPREEGRKAELGLGVPRGGRKKAFWMREYWDRYIRDGGHFRRVVEYIHRNPVEAGLCGRAEDWRWSSAAWWMLEGSAELGSAFPGGEELTHALSDHKLVAAQVTRYGIGCDRRRNG